MQPLYIFDLDGTLADVSHRLHFINGERKDYNAFFKASINDTPIEATVSLLHRLRASGARIMIWTGRSDIVKDDTLAWLDQYVCRTDTFSNTDLAYMQSILTMRKDSDHRHDHVIKQEWLQALPANVRASINGVFEDRSSVVDMWRRNGIVCYQVAPGDF